MKSFEFVLIAILSLILIPVADSAGAARERAHDDGAVSPQLFRYFECRQGTGEPRPRARCEAMARHELGLSVEMENPVGAASLFEKAILNDPSYSPPYFALARLSLDMGPGGEELFMKLKSYLLNAPKETKLIRLKARVDGLSRER